MKAVTGQVPPEHLAERRRVGADRWDEVRDGVLHMVPSPDLEHQGQEGALATWLRHRWAAESGGRVYHQVDVARAVEVLEVGVTGSTRRAPGADGWVRSALGIELRTEAERRLALRVHGEDASLGHVPQCDRRRRRPAARPPWRSGPDARWISCRPDGRKAYDHCLAPSTSPASRAAPMTMIPNAARRAVLRSMAAATLASLGAVTAARAQAPNPDPHWGAGAFPDARTSLRFSLSANRFTEFDGQGREYPSDTGYSTGFQIGTLSLTDRFRSCPNLTYTLSLGVGASSDQPTRALQNDFLHVIKGIDKVPVGETYSAFELVGGASATWWTDPVPRVPVAEHGDRWRLGLFAGAGASGGTLYQEVELHTGVYAQTPRVDLWVTRGALRIGAMARGSAHQPGAAFQTVSDYGLISQLEITWVSDRLDVQPWWLLGAPSLSLIATYDTGLFVDRSDGEAIETVFGSVRAEWPNGLRIETWNDMFGDSDYGPSYGFMVGFDVTALFGVTP